MQPMTLKIDENNSSFTSGVGEIEKWRKFVADSGMTQKSLEENPNKNQPRKTKLVSAPKNEIKFGTLV